MDRVIERLNFINVTIFAHKKFQDTGLAIANVFIVNGKLQFKDVEEHLRDAIFSEGSSVVETFSDMLKKRFIIPFDVESMKSDKDKALMDIEQALKAKGMFATKKVLQQEVTKIRTLKAKAKKEKKVTGFKKSSSEGQSKKKIKQMHYDDIDSAFFNQSSSVVEEKVTKEEIDDTLYFQINPEMISAMMRNEIIVKMFLNDGSTGLGITLNRIFTAIEPKTESFSDELSPPFHSKDIEEMMPPESLLKVHISIVGYDTNRTTSKLLIINEFLKALSEHPYKPLSKDTGTSNYNVNYAQLGPKIKKIYLEKLVKQKFGPEAWRVLNCLIERGKIDDKEMLRYVLLPINDIRKRCSELIKYELVQIQEVPKTIDRNPARSIYLWYCNLDIAYRSVVSVVEKTLLGLLETRAHLIQQNQMILQKSERTDVKQNLDLLTKPEQDYLAKLYSSLHQIDIRVKDCMEYLMIFKHL